MPKSFSKQNGKNQKKYTTYRYSSHIILLRLTKNNHLITHPTSLKQLNLCVTNSLSKILSNTLIKLQIWIFTNDNIRYY